VKQRFRRIAVKEFQNSFSSTAMRFQYMSQT